MGEEIEAVPVDALGGDGADPGDEPGQGGDAVALADAEDGGIDVGGAGLECGQGDGDRAAGVVVAVELDVGAHHRPHRAHQLLDVPGGGDADGVSDADAVRSTRVHRAVHRQQLLAIGAEGVLAAEADLAAGAAYVFDDLAGDVDDLVERAAVAGAAQHLGGGEQHVDPVGASLQRPVDVLDRAAGVGEHSRPRPAGHRRPEIRLRLGRRRRGGHLDVLHSKAVELGQDLQLLGGGEVGAGELLALAEGRVHDGHAIEAHAVASAGSRAPSRWTTASVTSVVVAAPPRSGVRAPASTAESTAALISVATAGSRSECSTSRATLRMAPSGLATPRPAMSGALPWIGSERAGPPAGFRLAEAISPSDPQMAAASSLRMSPRRFSATTTSRRSGCWSIRSAKLSTRA